MQFSESAMLTVGIEVDERFTIEGTLFEEKMFSMLLLENSSSRAASRLVGF